MRFPWSRKKAEEKAPDYSNYSADQLLDQFKTSNWQKCSEKEKMGILQEFENRNAAASGIEPAEVFSLDDPGLLGNYNGESNRIGVNLDTSSYETLDSLVHEGNHAFQKHCIENGRYDNDPTGEMIKAETARDDQGKLYNYRNGSPEYDMQVNELDSNNTAAEFMLSQADRFGDDPEYHKYLEEREAHFSEVNHDLDHRQAIRDGMQSDQIDAALDHGDISQSEHDQLSKCIYDDKYMDREEIRSHELQGEIAETRQRLENKEQNQKENTAEERPEELLGVSTGQNASQSAVETPSEEQQERPEDLLGYGNGGQEQSRRGYDPERGPEILDNNNSESIGELAPSGQSNYDNGWKDIDESKGQNQWDSLMQGPSGENSENNQGQQEEKASDLTGGAPVRDQNSYAGQDNSADRAEDNSEDNTNAYSY